MTSDIEIVVEGNPREADSLTSELHAWLQEKAPNFDYRRAKPDPTTMSMGAVLLILGPIAAEMGGVLLYEAAKDVARAAAAWMRRRRRNVVVRTSGEPDSPSLAPDQAERLILEYLKRKYPEIAKAEAGQQAADSGDAPKE